jgi:hypothetical protein
MNSLVNISSLDLTGGGGMAYEHEQFKNDCKNFQFIPHTLMHTSRTIICGDIHGDLDIAVKFLELAKCIVKSSVKCHNTVTLVNKQGEEEYYKWIGDDAIAVQVGDQIDRCRPVGDNLCIYPKSTYEDEASDIKILKFYTDLNKLAMKEGGRIISLLGNHELMNVSGNMRYVSYEGLKEFTDSENESTNLVDMADVNVIAKQGLTNRKAAFNNELEYKKKKHILKNIDSAFIDGVPLNEYLACTRLSAVIIGDLLFVHGGLVKKMAEAYNINDVNTIVRKWLLGSLTEELGAKDLLMTNKEKAKGTSKFNIKQRIEQFITDDQSIFWNRTLAYVPSDTSVEKCDEILKDTFKTWKISGIIIGHTPKIKEGITSACDGRIWDVDIGASNAFHSFKEGQKVEVLEITYTKDDKPIFKVLKEKN